MAELIPVPFSRLVDRAFEELERNDSIFELPRRKFVLGSKHDTSALIHGRRVATPLGPSAGPHTQMAQNIVLAWLAGGRVMELKTVQILDSITIQRPCIDARSVGYNIEWSQELSLEESLEEYVKASMLIEILARSGALDVQDGFAETIFDVSVGYDLEGIRSDRMARFLLSMKDATQTVEKVRRQIPAARAALRDLDFTTAIASSATLSTFHGCPAQEIEQIADFLMTELGLDCSIKLNPTLLGRRTINGILHDLLGFKDIEVPAATFETDLGWPAAVEMIGRLQARARELGRSFGVKLTNTLVVENRSIFLPAAEKLAYLSGAPLHVLAMTLVRRFRQTFGATLPISFSAGIDRVNYPDAVSLGLAPITVCTDLLKQGGYGRMAAYATELARRMDAVGARTIDEFILVARGHETLSVAEAMVTNTEEYVEWLPSDGRYRRERTIRATRWTGHPMGAFDCSTCDLCIPACPNAAVFRIGTRSAIPFPQAVRHADSWSRVDGGSTTLSKAHQIAIYEDACNDCGNCETFCPDFGAPNQIKVRLFGSEESWRRSGKDGFFVEPARVLGRIETAEYSLHIDGERHTFAGASCNLVIHKDSISGTSAGDPDLWPYSLMLWVRSAVLDASSVNFINCSTEEELVAQ